MKNMEAHRAASYLDRIDALVERLGMPGGIGRLLGWLMICEPACQTPDELAQATGLPREALEAQLAGLVRSETVDRIEMPDRPSPCYALRSPEALIERRLRQMQELIGVMDEAMALVGEDEADVRERLERFRDMYVRFSDDMRALAAPPHRTQA